MKIKIAERLHPFSHVPGIMLLLPGSTIVLQVFPALLRLRGLADVKIHLTGPVRDFTVIQDLEHGQVHVSGHAQEGYFRYILSAEQDKVALQIVKGAISFDSTPHIVRGKTAQIPGERLSLGCHKAQDWTLMQRRLLMEELLPIWFRLGQMTPPDKASCTGLLKLCQEGSIHAFQNLFLAGFEGLFVPRMRDEQHQGFALPPIEQGNPMTLLTEGARLIRQLFIQQEQNRLHILPKLPPQFHSGRMTQIQCPPYGQLDLEWSKKEIRRLIFRAEVDGEIEFQFQKNLSEFRLNRQEFVKCGTPITISKDNEYFLDNFRH